MAAAREFAGAARPARTQRISAADAAALVRSGDWVEYGAGMGQPDGLFDFNEFCSLIGFEDVWAFERQWARDERPSNAAARGKSRR